MVFLRTMVAKTIRTMNIIRSPRSYQQFLHLSTEKGCIQAHRQGGCDGCERTLPPPPPHRPKRCATIFFSLAGIVSFYCKGCSGKFFLKSYTPPLKSKMVRPYWTPVIGVPNFLTNQQQENSYYRYQQTRNL